MYSLPHSIWWLMLIKSILTGTGYRRYQYHCSIWDNVRCANSSSTRWLGWTQPNKQGHFFSHVWAVGKINWPCCCEGRHSVWPRPPKYPQAHSAFHQASTYQCCDAQDHPTYCKQECLCQLFATYLKDMTFNGMYLQFALSCMLMAYDPQHCTSQLNGVEIDTLDLGFDSATSSRASCSIRTLKTQHCITGMKTIQSERKSSHQYE